MDRHTANRVANQATLPPMAPYWVAVAAALPLAGAAVVAVVFNAHAGLTALVLYGALLVPWWGLRFALGRHGCLRLATLSLAVGVIVAIAAGPFAIAFTLIVAGLACVAVMGPHFAEAWRSPR